MENKSYGILMRSHSVSENICIFHPLYLVAGRDTGEDFEDEMRNSYPYSTDSEEFVLDKNKLSIAYILSEDELKDRYAGISLEEAKMAYFGDINQSIHIGCYKEAEDKLLLLTYGTEEFIEFLVGEINDLKAEESVQGQHTIRMKRPNMEETDTSESLIVEELIPITVSEFRKILDIREEEKLRGVLQSMYEQFQNGYLPVTVEMDENEIYPSLENQEINGKKIITFFTSICNRILTSKSMEQISKLETNFTNGFTQIIAILDTHGNDDIAADAAEEILYRVMAEVAMITSSRDLARIKLDIADVLKSERDEIAKVADIFDEYDVKIYGNAPKPIKEEIASSQSLTEGKVNAKSLKEFFDRRIAGQEDAKKTIISAVVMNSLSENAEERISCFLVGPTGSGKTLIAKTLGEYLDIPYVIVDSTQLTSAGYVGRDIEDFLARLIAKANGDLNRAENGIVVFDELDKKGSDKKSDISGKAVLNALLPFFQGTDYEVKKGKDKVLFNTSRLTIFATGACVDIAKAKLQREGLGLYKSTQIGFSAELPSKKLEEDLVYPELELEDFSKYGGIPEELIGRITTICQLSGHTVESLKFILTGIETSTLLSLKRNLAKIGITLSWTDGYLGAVANRAILLKTGARSLKTTVESSVKEARWEVLTAPERYSGILLTQECVEDPFKCKLIDKDGEEFSVQEVVVQRDSSSEKIKKIGVLQ